MFKTYLYQAQYPLYTTGRYLYKSQYCPDLTSTVLPIYPGKLLQLGEGLVFADN